MPMPEAPVDEDRNVMAWQDDVWFSWKISSM
jgi:hypothetical protein